MKKAKPELDTALDLDGVFFLQNPSRRFRIRRALPAELHCEENTHVVAKFLSFDGQQTEVAYREGRFDLFPGDDDRFAAWAWKRLETLYDEGTRGVFLLADDEIEAAKNAALLGSTILPGLGTPFADPSRIKAMLAFNTFRAERRAS